MLESEADYQRFNIRPEDDASVIGKSPAAATVAGALARVAGTLGNPKLAFLGWLHDLPRRSGVEIQLPRSLEGALERMPEASFRVDVAPLQVKEQGKKSLPDPGQQALASHHLDYDEVSADAERRLRSAGPGDALKALSSLVEESPGDAVLARDVGMSAMLWGLPAQAFHLFRRVGDARPFEPPTYRAEAQSLVRLGKIDLAMATFEVALGGRWAGRFGDFHQIVAVEYRELLRRVTAGELATSVPDFAKERFAAVSAEVPVSRADLVVMITWNTDGTDVDLHVLEPGGEECFYQHRDTRSGGKLTQDVTQGYGPEMYVLPSAPSGRYQIRAHYYAADRNRASTRTKVSALILEDFGTPRQRVTEKTVVLDTRKQMHDLLRWCADRPPRWPLPEPSPGALGRPASGRPPLRYFASSSLAAFSATLVSGSFLNLATNALPPGPVAGEDRLQGSLPAPRLAVPWCRPRRARCRPRASSAWRSPSRPRRGDAGST